MGMGMANLTKNGWVYGYGYMGIDSFTKLVITEFMLPERMLPEFMLPEFMLPEFMLPEFMLVGCRKRIMERIG